MVLTVQNLCCRRGDLRVISGLSFQLDAGRALVLRGPNGSGKTTLLRTLAGLSPLAAGQFSVAEDSIAYAGHADGIKAQMTVTENLTFWARVFGGQQIETALRAFGLHSLQNRQAQHLSAGQKRRLGLARLLVTGRKLWLLDEPTVSLDAANVQVFADVVSRHLAAGGAAVIATHIDLGLKAAETLDITPYKATPDTGQNPFLAGDFT